MIKNYRNGFLAAAIAVMATGCGGASDEDPLQDPNVGTNVGDEDPATLQGIADLIGGLVLEVMGTSSLVFDTFSVVSDKDSSIGKLLSAPSQSATPVGINTVVGAHCSGADSYNPADTADKDYNYFELAVLLEIVDNSGPDGPVKKTPAFDNGLKELANGNLQTNLDMRFRTCNEPKHTYNDDPNDSIFQDGDVRVLDGNFTIVLSSETDLEGAPDNTNDFNLSGNITMDNYFVQTDLAAKPDVVSGGFNLSLITDDVDEGNFSSYIYGNITTNDADKGGSNTVDFTVDGTLKLGEDEDKNITVDTYNVSVKGNVSSTIPGSTGNYRLFSEGSIEKSLDSDGLVVDGVYPSKGKIGIIDQATGYMHFATADANGLNFDLQDNDAGERKTATCTWAQIEDETCDVNAQ